MTVPAPEPRDGITADTRFLALHALQEARPGAGRDAAQDAPRGSAHLDFEVGDEHLELEPEVWMILGVGNMPHMMFRYFWISLDDLKRQDHDMTKKDIIV